MVPSSSVGFESFLMTVLYLPITNAALHPKARDAARMSRPRGSSIVLKSNPLQYAIPSSNNFLPPRS